MAEVNYEVVGVVAGTVVEQWFNSDLLAFEYFVFVEPSKRQGILATRLVLTFQEWARIKGAREIHLGISTGLNVESTTRFYESLGFQNAGPLLKKEL